MNQYVNPANAVTAARFLTLPPFWRCVDTGEYQYATLLIILCGLGDLLDGKVARLFNCMSGFGEMLDAIADAICYGFFVFALAWFGWVPWVPVVITVALGAVNSVLRAIYSRRVGRTTNFQSHAMERLVAYAAFLGGYGTARFSVDWYFWVFPSMMAIVLVYDFKRMILDPVPA